VAVIIIRASRLASGFDTPQWSPQAACQVLCQAFAVVAVAVKLMSVMTVAGRSAVLIEDPVCFVPAGGHRCQS